MPQNGQRTAEFKLFFAVEVVGEDRPIGCRDKVMSSINAGISWPTPESLSGGASGPARGQPFLADDNTLNFVAYGGIEIS